ncbi:acyl-CoA dehydrogenase family member 9, mitochondrial [Orussus abietinus]|uniref:acyl-CoA dehydrogenase family member 9, mitochondrial n=1 Tax=Orussus abietinus TaxID=222816 RepID=UPI00062645DB|nr:acyl-CoA dehydrogenase family member 9, mitochondrial [Orussus abietinus]XP_012271277.1 acyl-CoA dehydrogenase family member 9, mitochondrial [Orussus abietinus]
MLIQQLILKRGFPVSSRVCIYLRYLSHSVTKEDTDLISHLDLRLSPHIKRQPQREPFVKNFMLGKFDTELLAYPEVTSDSRFKEFNEWLKMIQDFINSYFTEEQKNGTAPFPSDMLERLKELGLFRAKISEEYNGLNLCETECTQLAETLSSVSSLGNYFVKHIISPVYLISKYGTEEQKKEYLPRIAIGDLLPTLCIQETNSDIIAGEFHTTATLSDCKKFWKLNGEKLYVPNGEHANLYVVFSLCLQSGDIYKRDKTLSVLLVENSTSGISCEKPVSTLGQSNLQLNKVIFNDIIVPKHNLLGEIGSGNSILLELLSKEHCYLGAQSVALLKGFMNHLTNHVISRQHNNKPFHEFHSVQEVIGKISSSLYSLESMTYFTTGMMDTYENPDCLVESTIVWLHSARECINNIYQGLEVIGPQAYLKEYPYERYLRDALALSLMETPLADNDTLIALLGLQHAGKVVHSDVLKFRNPLMYPKFIMQRFMSKSKEVNLHLNEYLHPSLEWCAILLENTIDNLKKSVHTVFNRRGITVVEHHMDLKRLSEIMSCAFSLTCALSRASRSYCIGLRNADHEMDMCKVIAYQFNERITRINQDLNSDEILNGDRIYQQVSKGVFKKKDHVTEHPTTRNY